MSKVVSYEFEKVDYYSIFEREEYFRFSLKGWRYGMYRDENGEEIYSSPIDVLVTFYKDLGSSFVSNRQRLETIHVDGIAIPDNTPYLCFLPNGEVSKLFNEFHERIFEWSENRNKEDFYQG